MLFYDKTVMCWVFQEYFLEVFFFRCKFTFILKRFPKEFSPRYWPVTECIRPAGRVWVVMAVWANLQRMLPGKCAMLVKLKKGTFNCEREGVTLTNNTNSWYSIHSRTSCTGHWFGLVCNLVPSDPMPVAYIVHVLHVCPRAPKPHMSSGSICKGFCQDYLYKCGGSWSHY